LKLLLTGTAGFIGFHLAKKLLKNNYEVLGIDNLNNYYDISLKNDRLKILQSYDSFKFEKVDISNQEQFSKIFKNFKPAKVVNLAAQPGVRYSLINPYAYMNSNLVGFLNVLELCRKYHVEGLIYASSSSVYGDSKKKPFNIDDHADKPISLYGATKRANELIAHSYSHLYNIKTTGLRFFTVYGPWYRPDMAMHIFAKKISNKEPIDVFNKGEMKRDFTFIDDIIEGTISSIEKNYNCEIFNLGNNRSENLMDVIKLIEDNLGLKAIINFKPIQPGDVLETYANIEHSQQKLNFQPKINIDQGIQYFTDWFRSYYNV
tara:strand:+ start:2274 stop:3227 length:954 start_codon:yes stop_codon:yes gene_type:complete